MDRLEKEVLEYPGYVLFSPFLVLMYMFVIINSRNRFKSTPTLVTGFEARRLPRAFLVLLENLLHKSPLGRPSCERVSTAIKEGKVCSF